MRSWLAKIIILLNSRDLVSCDTEITHSRVHARTALHAEMRRKGATMATVIVTMKLQDVIELLQQLDDACVEIELER
jgi:hypothetical protein